MTTYHDAPFTLEAERTIPADAPLSAGHTPEDAAEVAAADAEWTTEELTLEITVAAYPNLNLDAYADVTYGALVFNEDYRVRLNWGDGIEEIASELPENHPYREAGSYVVTATIEQPGYPSLEREAIATVPGEEPEA